MKWQSPKSVEEDEYEAFIVIVIFPNYEEQ